MLLSIALGAAGLIGGHNGLAGHPRASTVIRLARVLDLRVAAILHD
jgi:hypothetical protein